MHPCRDDVSGMAVSSPVHEGIVVDHVSMWWSCGLQGTVPCGGNTPLLANIQSGAHEIAFQHGGHGDMDSFPSRGAWFLGKTGQYMGDEDGGLEVGYLHDRAVAAGQAVVDYGQGVAHVGQGDVAHVGQGVANAVDQVVTNVD